MPQLYSELYYYQQYLQYLLLIRLKYIYYNYIYYNQAFFNIIEICLNVELYIIYTVCINIINIAKITVKNSKYNLRSHK